MFEEYFKAAKANDTPGKTFRLKIWLFEAKEEELTPEDISKAKRQDFALLVAPDTVSRHRWQDHC